VVGSQVVGSQVVSLVLEVKKVAAILDNLLERAQRAARMTVR
jgi:hypothetical protein